MVPRRPLWRDRRRCRETAAALASLPGSAPSPGTPVLPWQAAPFHYGDRRSIEQAARGSLGGHPAASFAYCAVHNGVPQWSMVLELRLSEPSVPVEVFHERPYTAPNVTLPTALPVQPSGDAALDRAWQVRFDTAVMDPRPSARLVAEALAAAPEPFSLRAERDVLVVWKVGGFASAQNAEMCAGAAVRAVDALGASLPVAVTTAADSADPWR
ncbi:hypothetical protein [Streptacidiphilus sp. MAP12-20]|uniref:hypothetical protein n=1 Tax=Streptacidiphilus sp. MAP12-20 TaxID=3156299 RepID=UPI003516A49C